jgi:hypothetical protein
MSRNDKVAQMNRSTTIYVYFDNLTIKHFSGVLLSENTYYPYGLTMSGISATAALKQASK